MRPDRSALTEEGGGARTSKRSALGLGVALQAAHAKPTKRAHPGAAESVLVITTVESRG